MVLSNGKFKTLLSVFTVCAAIAFMLMGAGKALATWVPGCVYCDLDGNGQLLWPDIPLSGVRVDVNNLSGTFSNFGYTEENGCAFVPIPVGTDMYRQTLDPNTLPPDATILMPVAGEYIFDDASVMYFNWLIDSAICDQVQAGECRMTGGGVDVNGEILLGTFASASDQSDRYTFGGQIGAPTASQPQPYGEWTHHQQKGPSGDFIFRAGTASAPKDTMITLVTCSDPGYCKPARPAPFKQIDYEGIGSFRNVKGSLNSVVIPDNKPNYTKHYFRAHVEDIGEPGAGGKQIKDTQCTHVPGTLIDLSQCEHCPDVYQIEIYATEDPASHVIYSVGGFINGGNLQIHPPIQ